MFLETLYYHINSPLQALHLIGHECLEKAILSYRFRARYAVSSLQSELTNSAVRYVLHICRISLVVHLLNSFSCTFKKGTNLLEFFLQNECNRVMCDWFYMFIRYLCIGFLLQTFYLSFPKSRNYVYSHASFSFLYWLLCCKHVQTVNASFVFLDTINN
jgi:hypothetical protein